MCVVMWPCEYRLVCVWSCGPVNIGLCVWSCGPVNIGLCVCVVMWPCEYRLVCVCGHVAL